MARLDSKLADEHLGALIADYERSGVPIKVRFRSMLRSPSVRERASHDIHHYPARLLLNIPAFFLSTTLTRPGDLVLDPFCGSGTVLLEALYAGRNVAGADSNPLARLITQTKLTPIPADELKKEKQRFFRNLPQSADRNFPDVINLDYWFYPHVQRDLLRLLTRINSIKNKPIKDLFTVTFSASLKDVSLADPRLSVPVRLREDKYSEKHWLYKQTKSRLRGLKTIDVIENFKKRLDENIERVESLSSWNQMGSFIGLAEDARTMTNLETGSVDCIITSPPYIGAQKYIRAGSLSLTWLGLCSSSQLRELEDRNIGREHYPKAKYATVVSTPLRDADLLLAKIRELAPLRAHIAANYLIEIKDALRELYRVLKPQGHVVLIVGESRIGGFRFPTPEFIASIASSEGLSLRFHAIDTIQSRALLTKRHRTAGTIEFESVLLLRKDR